MELVRVDLGSKAGTLEGLQVCAARVLRLVELMHT